MTTAGSIIQITNPKHAWFGCLAIVSELRPTIQDDDDVSIIHAYIIVPGFSKDRNVTDKWFTILTGSDYEEIKDGRPVILLPTG